MEGFIVNNCGKPKYIFKRNFPVGHRVYLSDLWKMYKVKVGKALNKEVVSEEEFVAWLTDNNYMKMGFVYHPGETATFTGEVLESSSGDVDSKESRADGRLVKPSLAKASAHVIDKLTYSDIANLRILDDPRRVVESITNVHKLRRAYTTVRQMSRKGHLQKILRDRIQDLERL